MKTLISKIKSWWWNRNYRKSLEIPTTKIGKYGIQGW